MPSSATPPSRARVAFAFALVYVFWGSTYLGIRLAVNHLSPFMMGATRFLAAGPLLLAWCAATGRRVAITRDEAWRLAIIGVLFLTTANVFVAWGELYVPTGLTALIVASVPLWVMLIETFGLGHARPPARGIAGIFIGIAGIVVLLWPQLIGGAVLRGKTLFGTALLTEAAVSWALGSVLARRWRMPLDAMTAAGWQMTFAGAVNLVVAAALGDIPRAHWTAGAFGAIAYLVVFGSWVGMSAYVWLLKHVPTAKVATYAYVNPVVAVLLGWLVLHETVDLFVLAGTVIIVASVALVTTARSTEAPRKPIIELPACEQGAD